MLHHLPAISAVTAPSPVSYLRLVPNRWAPTEIDIVQQDRGASLRVCPVFAAARPPERAAQYNVEFRRDVRPQAPISRSARSSSPAWTGCGAGSSCRRPRECRADPARHARRSTRRTGGEHAAAEWFGPVLLEAYLRHKRAELAHVGEVDPAALCARYAEVY